MINLLVPILLMFIISPNLFASVAASDQLPIARVVAVDPIPIIKIANIMDIVKDVVPGSLVALDLDETLVGQYERNGPIKLLNDYTPDILQSISVIKDVEIILVTSASKAYADECLKSANIMYFFDKIYCLDEVQTKADLISKHISLMHAKPPKVLLVDDQIKHHEKAKTIPNIRRFLFTAWHEMYDLLLLANHMNTLVAGVKEKLVELKMDIPTLIDALGISRPAHRG